MTAGSRPTLVEAERTAIEAAVAEARTSPGPLTFLVVEHGDVGAATAAVEDAFRRAGAEPATVRTVEGPGRLADHLVLPDNDVADVLLVDARRGRMHQVADAIHRLAGQSRPKRTVVITTHFDARALARMAEGVSHDVRTTILR